MKRRLVNLFVAVSLVMFILAIKVTVASFFIGFFCHRVRWQTEREDATKHRTIVQVGRGIIGISRDAEHSIGTWDDLSQGNPGKAEFDWTIQPARQFPFDQREPKSIWSRLGFARIEQASGGNGGGMQQLICIPIWPLIVATAPVPLGMAAHRLRRARRANNGLCLTCGYNLTGNVSGVCPECGTAVPPKAAEKGPTV